MLWMKKVRLGWVMLLLVAAVLSACSSVPVKKLTVGPAAAPSGARVAGKGWWYARFHMAWPAGAEPLWHVDPFLAHEVVLPALMLGGEKIELWRFHRRAARDASGHQFSFIFYADPATADLVFSSLQSSPSLNALKTAGIVQRDSYDDTGKITRPDIEDTSDPNWSPAIQKSWPYFIMGVSQAWLDWIDQATAQRMPEGQSLSWKEALAFYKTLNEEITAAWREEGEHAFLHHLNALFGYEPLVIHEKRLTTF